MAVRSRKETLMSKSQRQIRRDRLVYEEVQEIFAMFRALQCSYDAIADKTGIVESLVHFDGFDANNEGEHLESIRKVILL
jgi:uncharacterized protein YfbU (UPF0304 family)